MSVGELLDNVAGGCESGDETDPSNDPATRSQVCAERIQNMSNDSTGATDDYPLTSCLGSQRTRCAIVIIAVGQRDQEGNVCE